MLDKMTLYFANGLQDHQTRLSATFSYGICQGKSLHTLLPKSMDELQECINESI